MHNNLHLVCYNTVPLQLDSSRGQWYADIGRCLTPWYYLIQVVMGQGYVYSIFQFGLTSIHDYPAIQLSICVLVLKRVPLPKIGSLVWAQQIPSKPTRKEIGWFAHLWFDYSKLITILRPLNQANRALWVGTLFNRILLPFMPPKCFYFRAISAIAHKLAKNVQRILGEKESY